MTVALLGPANLSLRSAVSVAGREDSNPMDCPRSHPVQEVHLRQRRVELRDRHVGSHVLRGAALLGHDQSGRTYLASRSPLKLFPRLPKKKSFFFSSFAPPLPLLAEHQRSLMGVFLSENFSHTDPPRHNEII